jgi:hypothetical protein
MVTAAGHPQSVYARRQRARELQHAKRVAALFALGAVLVLTLLLTAFGSGHPDAPAAGPAPAARLLPAGPPRLQVIALQGALRIQMPIAQSRATAIGYHASGADSLAFQPVGRQANQGLFSRLFHGIFGGGGGGLRYYLLGGGSGPATASLDVGAEPGTDVYSPVDGTVVGITDYILDGHRYGSRIDVQPAAAPSLVVSLTQLRSDPSLTVGSSVAAATSKLGTVLDFSKVERQALARFTQDSGNHVSLEIHPAATLALR